MAYALGTERCRELTKLTDAQLVDGTRSLVEDALERFGVTDTAAVDMVVQQVERHAAKTLFDERPAPLPAPLVNRMAAAAKRNGAKP